MHDGIDTDAIQPKPNVRLNLRRKDSDGPLVLTRENEVITSVNLGANELGPEGTAHLARMLATNRALTAVNLSGNAIGDEGAQHLVEMLPHNTTLLVLDVADNAIAEPAKERLRAAWNGREPAGLRT